MGSMEESIDGGVLIPLDAFTIMIEVYGRVSLFLINGALNLV